ncbi:MAG: hypothetical protein MI920_22755 [Kiloniellales bacterium]|nr:hypothetical protein [Kiloniellales bacterium]
MRAILIASVLCIALAATPSAVEAEEGSPDEDPGELALEGVDRLMRALNALIEMIPQYELPEMKDNGDIVIRRKRKRSPQPLDPEIDETNT